MDWPYNINFNIDWDHLGFSNEEETQSGQTKKSNKKNNSIVASPFLQQGKEFSKIAYKEGFQTNDTNNNSKNSNSNSALKEEYEKTLAQFQKVYNEITTSATDYINRTNPSNPFLNKNIRFTTGETCYVTNQGVAKLIPNEEIWNSLRNSPGKTVINLQIPWRKEYVVPGTMIPTSPPLVSGTSMILGQSCGNEGLNVYVDKLVNNSSTKYDGCFTSNAMTYIGGDPPSASQGSIQNSDFSRGKIANNSYQVLNKDTTTVPGWNFSCALLNNSTAWGYPMPYPNGDQCASIQKTQQLWTANWIDFAPGVNYTLTWDAVGRNCCDKSGIGNAIDIGLEDKKIFSFTPAVGKWNTYSTSFKVDTQQSKRISFKGTWSSSDRASAIKNIVLKTGNDLIAGAYNFEMCKQEAVDGGYKYFGLEGVNKDTGLGFCGVSNDSVGVFQKGKATAVTGGNIVWSSKTKDGMSFSLTKQGSLTVYNSMSAAIFNTDNSKAEPDNYLGCYADKKNRALAMQPGSKYDYDSCKALAEKNKMQYFSLQNSSTGTKAECGMTNELGSARKYGVAGNCKRIEDKNTDSVLYSGGGWANALYSVDGSSVYYLILQDDGNMCIYRGAGPDDNQGLIWSSNTAGKQSKPNPDFTALKSKFGKNWIVSGTSLSKGDFVGSNDGSIYLMMQPDGNLTLNTSQDAENCQRTKDGYFAGGKKATAVYEVTETGIPDHLGKLAYIDANTTLYSIPEENISLSTTYKSYKNLDSSSAKTIQTEGKTTVEKCKDSCTKTKECYGFVFNKETNTCYLKDSSLRKEARQTMRGSSIYMRDQKLQNMPAGITDKVVNIDSITYGEYPAAKTGEVLGDDNKWSLKYANTVKKQELDQLQGKLNTLSKQLTADTNVLSDEEKAIRQQAKGVNPELYNEVMNKMRWTNETNMDKMVRDSEINVLRDNYHYIFWSVVAAGAILVSMKLSQRSE